MRTEALGTLVVLMLTACAHGAPPKKPNGGSTMSSAACNKTIGPKDAPWLKSILSELPDGGVLCLTAGTYQANLWIERSVTIRGTGNVVIDGAHKKSTLAVAGEHIDVTIEGVTLRNGDGTAGGRGGNLWLGADAKVTLRDVVLENGTSSENGGGGFLAHEGTLLLERCRIVKNSGKRANAAIVDGGAKVTMRDCLVADNGDDTPRKRPAILVGEAAHVDIDHTTIVQTGASAVAVAGTLGTAPGLRITHSILGDTSIESSTPGPSAQIAVADSALASALPPGVNGSQNVVGPLGLDADHWPAPTSISNGRGRRCLQ
jgi:hypothetical protein